MFYFHGIVRERLKHKNVIVFDHFCESIFPTQIILGRSIQEKFNILRFF